MLILSVDTSCDTSLVTLTEDGKVLSFEALNNKKSHSVKLMPEIEQVFCDSGKNLMDTDAIAVVNGPGSYTGLRIGVATCKLLAYCSKRPLITVKTPDFLANSCGDLPDKSIVCAAIDARNTQMFYALYEVSNSGNGEVNYNIIGDYDAEAASVVCDRIKQVLASKGASAVCFIGDGAVKNEALLREIMGDAFRIAPEDVVLGDPSVIGRLAEKIYENAADKSVFAPENTEVFYLRTPHLTIKRRD